MGRETCTPRARQRERKIRAKERSRMRR
ncbi:hypothetical protein E2C01_023278 [Portunus trituberculatus]|uniref:Uncharacterized protein n=1 Tax=Portunus trituberculatus TaxID=210409 RepID=A0A5B7EB62_PORTR|nr:hypothetical protein [Portunus trituberculatus]